MRLLSFVLFFLLTLSGLSAPPPAPYPIPVDSQDGSDLTALTLYQGNQRTLRAQFTSGGTNDDLTGCSAFADWFITRSGGMVTAQWALVSGATGAVDFTWTAADLNTNGGPWYWECGVKDASGNIVTYKQGQFTLIKSPYATGAGSVNFATNQNWATINWVGLPYYLDSLSIVTGAGFSISHGSSHSATINVPASASADITGVTNHPQSLITLTASTGPEPGVGLFTSDVARVATRLLVDLSNTAASGGGWAGSSSLVTIAASGFNNSSGQFLRTSMLSDLSNNVASISGQVDAVELGFYGASGQYLKVNHLISLSNAVGGWVGSSSILYAADTALRGSDAAFTTQVASLRGSDAALTTAVESVTAGWSGSSGSLTTARSTWLASSNEFGSGVRGWVGASGTLASGGSGWTGSSSTLYAAKSGWEGASSTLAGASAGWVGSSSVLYSARNGWLGASSTLSGASGGWVGSSSVLYAAKSGWEGASSVLYSADTALRGSDAALSTAVQSAHSYAGLGVTNAATAYTYAGLSFTNSTNALAIGRTGAVLRTGSTATGPWTNTSGELVLGDDSTAAQLTMYDGVAATRFVWRMDADGEGLGQLGGHTFLSSIDGALRTDSGLYFPSNSTRTALYLKRVATSQLVFNAEVVLTESNAAQYGLTKELNTNALRASGGFTAQVARFTQELSTRTASQGAELLTNPDATTSPTGWKQGGSIVWASDRFTLNAALAGTLSQSNNVSITPYKSYSFGVNQLAGATGSVCLTVGGYTSSWAYTTVGAWTTTFSSVDASNIVLYLASTNGQSIYDSFSLKQHRGANAYVDQDLFVGRNVGIGEGLDVRSNFTWNGGGENASTNIFQRTGGNISGVTIISNGFASGIGHNIGLGLSMADNAIAGGRYNHIEDSYGFIGGGESNLVESNYAAVLAGKHNDASGYGSTIIGGQYGYVDGQDSVILGGWSNTVSGADSVGAGRHANATNDRTFVWSDGTILSGTDNTNQVLFISANGLWLRGGPFRGSGSLITDLPINGASSTWATASAGFNNSSNQFTKGQIATQLVDRVVSLSNPVTNHYLKFDGAVWTNAAGGSADAGWVGSSQVLYNAAVNGSNLALIASNLAASKYSETNTWTPQLAHVTGTYLTLVPGKYKSWSYTASNAWTLDLAGFPIGDDATFHLSVFAKTNPITYGAGIRTTGIAAHTNITWSATTNTVVVLDKAAGSHLAGIYQLAP